MLAATKRRPLNALLTPHLGYGSAAALGQAAGKTAAQVSQSCCDVVCFGSFLFACMTAVRCIEGRWIDRSNQHLAKI